MAERSLMENIIPSVWETRTTRGFNVEYDNFGEPSEADFAYEEVVIEGFPHICTEVIHTDPDFFPISRMEDADPDVSEVPFDPNPPPSDMVVGANPYYMSILENYPHRLRTSEPELSEDAIATNDVPLPSDVFNDYPKAVTQYFVFESQMKPILPNGKIRKLICKLGTGDRFKSGDDVNINYYVYVEGYADCMDSNKILKQPYKVELGRKRSVLPILDLGTLSMAVKEVAAFLVYPEYAYGKNGSGESNTRQNRRVLCIIEALKKLPSSTPDSQSIYFMPSLIRARFSFQLVYQFAQEKQAEGERYIDRNMNARALNCFFQALTCMKQSVPVNESETRIKFDYMHALHGNAFLACYNARWIAVAIKVLKKNMQLPVSSQMKACDYFCCANLMYETRNWEEAKYYMDKAIVHFQNNIHAKCLLQEISHALAINDKENMPRRT